MHKRILAMAPAVLCLLLSSKAPLFAQNTRLLVNSGTTFTVGGSHLILQNTDLSNNGSFNAATGTVWVTGTNNSSFGGSGTPVIGTLQMNSGPSSVLTLANPLNVSMLVNFQQGVIDLHGQQLSLTGGAFLQGESESSHITSVTGGNVTASATGVVNPLQLDVGRLGAMISANASIGNLSISRMGKPAVNPGNPLQQGIDRTYLIQPQNNSGLNATLRFYYLNEELNGKDVTTLTLWKSLDGVNWSLIGADTRDGTNKYVEKSGIGDFSYWTLTDLANNLPVTLLSFKAACDNGSALVSWQTGVESGVNYFLVEGSSDGNQWAPLGKVAATNAPQGAGYSWQDDHPSGISYYRLEIVDQSGAVSYSPVFRGDCSDITLPFTLYPNPAVSQTSAQLSVRQATTAILQVVDVGGKILYRTQWNLQTGINTYVLPVAGLAAGTYIVTLSLPNSILQTILLKK